MEILPKIKSPSELKNLNIEELKKLCSEMREYLISVIPAVGGHFASSLGAVELTIAVHYVYDAPRDKIVWDVGHQGYVHKIITGRRDALKNIRQWGGISGFLRREESEFDVFGAGHASTAISAAAGIAAARDLENEDYKVIAIVGDGGMSGGITFEGLNNAGMLQKDITVILNDNRMSISPNVGAMERYLASIKTDPLFNKIKSEVWDLTAKIPKMTNKIRLLVQRIEESLKRLVVPGMWFENLGFKYIGPMDGHNLNELISFLSRAKEMKGPIFVHVMTKKGKGYSFAEEDPCKYHGVIPVSNNEWDKEMDVASYSKVFGNTIVKIAEKNEKVCAITAAMAEGTGLVSFREKFPERFFDVGIAESHAVIFSAGICVEGLRPVFAVYSTFLQRAYDQIIHDVALQSLPVVFAIDRAGLSGEDGPTHHGCFDLSYLNSAPNIIISAPKDGNELVDLLYTALEQESHPFAVRYPKDCALKFNPSRKPHIINIGSWEKISDGEEIVILAVGSMVNTAEETAKLLAKKDIYAGVVNCRFVKPFDKEMLSNILKVYKYFITIEENSVVGGFGSIISRYLVEQGLNLNFIYNFGIKDEFITHGPRAKLLEHVGLSASNLRNKIVEILNPKKNSILKNL